MQSDVPDFRNRYNKPAFSDVRLCLRDEVFYAHKVILMAHSELFETAFNSGLPISTALEYNIEGYQKDVVQAMIRHMYGYHFVAEFKTNKSTPVQLLDFSLEVFHIANEYQVRSLGRSVSEYIVSLLGFNSFEPDTSDPLIAMAVKKIVGLYGSCSVRDRSLLKALANAFFGCTLQQRQRVIDILEEAGLEPFTTELLKLQWC